MNKSRNQILALAGCLTTTLLTVLLLPVLLLMSIILSLFGTRHSSYMFYRPWQKERPPESGDAEAGIKINKDGSIEVQAKTLDGQQSSENYPEQ